MHVDSDASVGAAANPRAHGCSVASVTDDCLRRRLRDEDEVALGVGRHRVRAGRLRDGLDQDIGFRVDHAEYGTARLPVGAGVIAPIALVEPDLIRADNVGHVDGVSYYPCVDY